LTLKYFCVNICLLSIEVKMTIIKKLILRNKLMRQLNQLNCVIQKEYLDAQLKLSRFVYEPEMYASVSAEYQQQYDERMRALKQLQAKIDKLSGKNLFDKNLQI